MSQSNKCLVRTARKGNRGIGLLDVTVHKNSMFNRFCPTGLVDIWPGRSKSLVQCTLNPTKFSFTCHMKDLKKGIKMDASSWGYKSLHFTCFTSCVNLLPAVKNTTALVSSWVGLGQCVKVGWWPSPDADPLPGPQPQHYQKPSFLSAWTKTHQPDCIWIRELLSFLKTSKELRMLSIVTKNCQVTKIVIDPGSQLSVL